MFTTWKKFYALFRHVDDKSSVNFFRFLLGTQMFSPFSVLMIFFFCYFESEALNIIRHTSHGRGNNSDCRTVREAEKWNVGKWEDKPLIRVETHKNFSSVCIHSNECHYVFVTLLPLPTLLRGWERWIHFSPLCLWIQSGKFSSIFWRV